MIRTSLVILILATAGVCEAQTPGAANVGKYCGSGWTEKLVPDNPLGCKMSAACEKHDICYSKCDPGGSKAGSDYCKKSEFSLARLFAKSSCDTEFYDNIRNANPGKPKCETLGAIYAAAVMIGGQGPFNGRQLPPEVMRALAEDSASRDEAVAKFYAMATMSQRRELDLSRIKLDGTKIVLPANAQPATSDSTASRNAVKDVTSQELRGFILKDVQKK